MSEEEAQSPGAGSVAGATQYPLLPLRDVVVFPHMVIPLFVGRPKSIKAMEAAMESGKSILLVAHGRQGRSRPAGHVRHRLRV
jgi:ATP-dependent Lon protease